MAARSGRRKPVFLKIYNRISAKKPYKKLEAQKWKEMFFKKDASLCREFETFYTELQKVEAEDDDEDWIDIDDEAPDGTPSVLDAASSTSAPAKVKASAEAKRSVQRGDKTARMNAMNNWIAQRWNKASEEDKKTVRDDLELEYNKAMVLWNQCKEWAGTPLDFARLVNNHLHKSRTSLLTGVVRAQMSLEELAGNVLDTVASLVGGVAILHVAYHAHENGKLRVRSYVSILLRHTMSHHSQIAI
jgi:hypothetical protein